MIQKVLIPKEGNLSKFRKLETDDVARLVSGITRTPTRSF